MQTIIDFTVPASWHKLTDAQLKYVFSLLAYDYSTEQVKFLCLLRWSSTKVIGRQDNGTFLLKKDKRFFETSPLAFAEILPAMDWLTELPPVPVRLSKIGRHLGRRSFLSTAYCSKQTRTIRKIRFLPLQRP